MEKEPDLFYEKNYSSVPFPSISFNFLPQKKPNIGFSPRRKAKAFFSPQKSESIFSPVYLSRKKAIGRSKDLPTVFSFQKSKSIFSLFSLSPEKPKYRRESRYFGFSGGSLKRDRAGKIVYSGGRIKREKYVKKRFSLFRGESERGANILVFLGEHKRSIALNRWSESPNMVGPGFLSKNISPFSGLEYSLGISDQWNKTTTIKNQVNAVWLPTNVEYLENEESKDEYLEDNKEFGYEYLVSRSAHLSLSSHITEEINEQSAALEKEEVEDAYLKNKKFDVFLSSDHEKNHQLTRFKNEGLEQYPSLFSSLRPRRKDKTEEPQDKQNEEEVDKKYLYLYKGKIKRALIAK